MTNVFVLTVKFEVKSDRASDFAKAIAENAAASVHDEEGCLQFDVLRSQTNRECFFLYEVYTSKAAFEEHMKQPHTKKFLELAKEMVSGQSHRTFDRLAAPTKADVA